MQTKLLRKSTFSILLLALGCLTNSAVAEERDLSNPLETKPWDTKTKLWGFRGETRAQQGAGLGITLHGSMNRVLPVRMENPPISAPPSDRDGVTARRENQETPWEQLERALTPGTAKQRDNVTFRTTKLFRYISFNKLPDPSLDVLPLIANPGAAKSQAYTVRMTLTPEYRESPAGRLRLTTIPFGIALNGVLINRGKNDYWKIHNQAISKDILKILRKNERPTLIGYAADGYPIYGPYGYKKADNSQSALIELKPSFRVKESTTTENKNPSSGNNTVTTSSAHNSSNTTQETKPLAIYEYIDKLGDLDDYNGRFGVTPEYPEGTYYYVISNSFPYIPISFRGVPDKTFVPPEKEPSPEATAAKLKRLFPMSSPPFYKPFNPSRGSFDF